MPVNRVVHGTLTASALPKVSGELEELYPGLMLRAVSLDLPPQLPYQQPKCIWFTKNNEKYCIIFSNEIFFS